MGECHVLVSTAVNYKYNNNIIIIYKIYYSYNNLITEGLGDLRKERVCCASWISVAMDVKNIRVDRCCAHTH